jgi:hypothetical protein
MSGDPIAVPPGGGGEYTPRPLTPGDRIILEEIRNGYADRNGHTYVDIDSLPANDNGFTPSVLKYAAERKIQLVFRDNGVTLTFTYTAMLNALQGATDDETVYVIIKVADPNIQQDVYSTLHRSYWVIDELIYEVLFKIGDRIVTTVSEPVKVEIDLTRKPLTFAQLAKLKALRYKNGEGIELGGGNQWTNLVYTFFTSEFSVYLVAPQNARTVIKLTIGSPILYVNDIPFTMDVEPELVNDRTMVPLRFLYECLDARVNWNEETQIINIVGGSNMINLTVEIGKLQDGMDTVPYIKQDRAFVPVRFVTETLGGYVEWRQEGQMVYIVYDPVNPLR